MLASRSGAGVSTGSSAAASADTIAGGPNAGGGSAEGEVHSCHTATSAGGLQGALLGQQPPLQSIGVPGTMVTCPFGFPADGRGGGGGGESTSESLRTLTLPPLPKAGQDSSSMAFGDWLVMTNPVMRDLGTSASMWWDYVLRSAQESYGRWLTATPLERLRLRPALDSTLCRPAFRGWRVVVLICCWLLCLRSSRRRLWLRGDWRLLR